MRSGRSSKAADILSQGIHLVVVDLKGNTARPWLTDTKSAGRDSTRILTSICWPDEEGTALSSDSSRRGVASLKAGFTASNGMYG
jgi:hypothetical protein